MPLSISGIPAEITAAIDVLLDDLTRTAGANFAGFIGYGGLARGRFRRGKSDVNVVVLLHDASATSLSAIAPALLAGRRSAGIEPMILTPGEIIECGRVFPTKFLDIKRNHIVLAGEDPFASLQVSDEHIRLRIEQELRNMLLRLRSRSMNEAADPELLARPLIRVARPLAIELDALLRLSGAPALASDRTSVIFEAAAAAFGLDSAPLAELASLRHESRSRDDVAGIFGGVLDSITKALDAVARMKG